MELLAHSLWYKFYRPDMPDFGTNYLKDIQIQIDKFSANVDL